MKELPNTYLIGNARFVHAGFAAHKIVGRVDKPMERIGAVYASAEQAIEAVRLLGDGHAAFRVVRSGSETAINGRIEIDDLPVIITASA